MPQISVFLFKMKCENGKSVEDETLKRFEKLKIDTTGNLPWEGLLVSQEDKSITHVIDEWGNHRFIFGFEEEVEETAINGERVKSRHRTYTSLWTKKDLLLIFTSNSGIAFRIINKILNLKSNNLSFTPLKFETDFLRWLEIIEEYGTGSLVRIFGTKATHLEDVDGIADNLSFNTSNILNKSQLFSFIKGKGERVYLKSIFKIGGGEMNVTFYTNSKLTISKTKPPTMTTEEVKNNVESVYNELVKWHDKWKKKIRDLSP